MEIGAWLGISAFTLTAGQIVAASIRQRKLDQIANLQQEVDRLDKEYRRSRKAQQRCDENLKSAYAWIQWAQQSMVLKQGSGWQPHLPPLKLEIDDENDDPEVA